MPKQNDVSRHIVLTCHPSSFGPKPIPIQWGAAEPMERGPIIATLTNPLLSLWEKKNKSQIFNCR
ncbi:hypothetical protein [Nostoc favosum]|uniref:hypothetical protein n=1 Tax=Nostoc favosum TaxID=2907819 RepID=UPI003F689806